MQLKHEDRQRIARGAEEAANVLELVLRLMLWVAVGAIMSGALLIIIFMDASSRSQGGRIYVAILAMVALGGVDNRFRWLARRRWGPWLFEPWEYRRYRITSLLLLMLAFVVLFGCALFLP